MHSLWELEFSGQDKLHQEVLEAEKGRAEVRLTFPNVRVMVSCKKCEGSGAASCRSCGGIEADECFWCNGSGTQVYNGKTKSACKRCHGQGKYQCKPCNNTGKVACKSCGAKGNIEAELGCVIQARNVKLPALSVQPFANEAERTALLQTVCAQINRIDDLPSTTPMPMTPAATRGQLSGFPFAAPPQTTPWRSVSATCEILRHEFTHVAITKPATLTKKSSRPSLLGRNFGTWSPATRARNSPYGYAGLLEEHHFYVSNSEKVAIRRLGSRSTDPSRSNISHASRVS